MRFSYVAPHLRRVGVAVQRRVGRAGRERVDGDPVRRELDARASSSGRRSPPWRRCRRRSSASGWMSAAELTLTIRPPALLDHLPRRGAAAAEVSVQVGREQAVPVLVGRLEERLHEQPRGVVHPDVDAAEAARVRPRRRGRCVRHRRCRPATCSDRRPRASIERGRLSAPRRGSSPTTSAPASASATAIACPIPLAAPVTTARSPCSVIRPPADPGRT